MHNKASLVLSVGIMALSAWAAVSALAWPLKAALFPLVISIPVFCLATAELLWSVFGSSGKSEEMMDFQLSTHLPPAVMARRTLLAIAWTLGFFALIVLVGFLIAVPLFVFLYLKIQGREKWLFSVILTLATWAFFYGLFDQLLHLPFPDGWLIE